MLKPFSFAIVCAVVLGTAPAYANHHESGKHAAPVKQATSAVPASFNGGILVDGKGMTLYTFDKDTRHSGKSACNGECIAAWPALTADAHAKPEGKFSVITRDDGSHQWAYDGWPLYTWQGDKKPGERTGDNFLKIWHIVKK